MPEIRARSFMHVRKRVKRRGAHLRITLDMAPSDSSVRRFLWVCAGANPDILSRGECMTETSKYTVIGTTILLTAAFAALSGAFAFHLVFDSLLASAMLGLLWGAFILNLDRLIVLTLDKNSSALTQIGGA